MADVPASPTGTALSPGKQTSEFALTIALFVVGSVLDAAGTALAASHAGWAHLAIIAIGAVLQILSTLGYYKTRTAVKIAQVQTPNLGAIINAAIPAIGVAIAQASAAAAPAAAQPQPAAAQPAPAPANPQ